MDYFSTPKLNIRIKKRSWPEWLTMFIFFFTFFQASITELVGIPDVVKFIVDVLIVLLMGNLIMQKTLSFKKKIAPFLILITGLFLYTLIIYFFNYQSIFYYVWGLRNNFRFFCAFLIFVFYVDWSDAKKWLDALDVIYVINVFVVIIQYFGGFSQDYLGGIFGTQKGCNGSLLAFLCIVVAKSVLRFMREEESVVKCVLITISSLLVSALAELKVFFVFFVLIVILAAFMTKTTGRKILFLFFCLFSTITFSTLLSLLYEEFAQFLSFENLWNALMNPNYATDEDIGRITAIPVITESFMNGISDVLFGLGLGNCDSSSIPIFNTPFYDSYYSYHYAYFSYAMWYLEAGAVGLIGYVSFFVSSFVFSLKSIVKRTSDDLTCQLAMVMAVICCILLIYNISLRNEIAYLIFFVLALPLISEGKQRNHDMLSANAVDI